MATKKAKAVVKKVSKNTPNRPGKKAAAARVKVGGAIGRDTVAYKPKPCPPAPPCPEIDPLDNPENGSTGPFDAVLAMFNTPLPTTNIEDPSADNDAHFTRTPLVDIPEFATAVARYDLVRGYIKALDEIKDRLSGDLKTWMGLGGLESTVAMGFKLDTVTTERKTFDRDRAVTVAHLTEEQIEASMKVSKSTQLRVTQLKPQVEEAQ